MVSFFLKDFEDALTRFRILIPGAKLPFGLLKRSIDYAAAAALALGHHEEAAQYQQHLSTMR
jgi:hypothetical protein